MAIRNGDGYVLQTANNQSTLGIQKEFADMYDGSMNQLAQQFECTVVSETSGEGTVHYLKTRKGVVNYTWSGFPFRPEPTYPGEAPYIIYEKQAVITDWAVYQNGTRTAGASPSSEYMASDGKIQLPAGTPGLSMLVLMSKIDWWDRDGWHAARRLIDAEMPFVSVIPTSDATAMATLATQQGNSWIYGGAVYFAGAITGFSFDPPYPLTIGYTYKKIAQLDWNVATNKWDVTQYEYGPMNVRVHAVTGTMYFEYGNAPVPSTYDDALAIQFGGCLNHPWFEGTWAIPGYTLNPANWWTHLVNI